jgi:hypothetical protein
LTVALATFAVISSAIIGNRILALLVGFCLKVPSALLLSVLVAMDAIQIPLYYWLYRQGAKGIDRLPERLRGFFRHDWSGTAVGGWFLNGKPWRVMAVAALPAFGGGIWTATLMAYNLKLSRRAGAAWMMAGSALSYFVLWSMGEGVLRLVKQWTL